MHLYFITGNQHKLAEIQAILPQVEQINIDLPEIQSSDPREIIRAKLLEARKHHQGACIVEDTGLYLEVMNGLPGPFIKFFIKSLWSQGFAEMVLKLNSPKAQARTYIGYTDETGNIEIFEGKVEGEIVLPRQESAFGRDPIFQPQGYSQTYAELTSEEKNTISMRRLAVEKLKIFLEQRGEIDQHLKESR